MYELGLFVVDAGREKMEEVDSFFGSSLSDSELHGGHRIAAHTLAFKLVGLSTKVSWRAEDCSSYLRREIAERDSFRGPIVAEKRLHVLTA